MKKTLIPAAVLLTIFLAFTFTQGLDIETVSSRTVTIDKLHNQPLVIPGITVVGGDSIYLSSLELRGTWQKTTAPATPWPWQAFQWYSNVSDDNPLAPLNWTGITLDTTWAVASITGGGKYTIDKKITQSFQNGVWSNATATGWLANTNTWAVEVYTKSGSNQTLVKTLGFNPATGDTAFRRATFEVSYKAEGRGVYPAGTPAVPDSLISALAQARIYFQTGMADRAFQVPTGTDSLIFVFKNGATSFASYSIGVTISTVAQSGVVPEIQITNPLPPAGYYSAGDTIKFNANLFTNGGDTLKWWINPQQYGINRLEVVVSGPKNDYAQVFSNRYIINNYAFAYDSVSGGLYSNNPIKIPLPAVLPGGPGTYTIYIAARRIFGETVTKGLTKDFQVGTTVVGQLPVSSLIPGQSCASCHGVNGPTGHHGAAGAEQCLPCHVDNFRTIYGFSELVHSEHQNLPQVNLTLGNCSDCHLNGTENQFTSDAQDVCTACHGYVPYMAEDHLVAVPLYAPSGLSCATANCHAGGGVGVFKNITETHQGLATKYANVNIAAKKTVNAPVIDGVKDPVWSLADSIVSKTGITAKFLYDDTYIYTMTTWKDGHKNYGTDSASSNSIYRNRWSYDGTAWSKKGDEDRIAFTWKMNDPWGGSCARSCHGGGTAPSHKTSTGKYDVWHWKAQRTNPIAFADDQYWDNAGRKNDATTRGTFGVDNLSGLLPLKQALTSPGNLADFLFSSQVQPFANSGWAAGDMIPGWIVNDTINPSPIAGSRSDLNSKGVYNPATGYWTVEIKRLLNTGNTADDVVFDPAQIYDFSVAQFDNTGSKHSTQGIDATRYFLSFSQVIVPVELASLSASVSDAKVVLNWTTSSEKNSYGFEIERKTESVEWTKLGFVKSSGTSTTVHAYQFVDSKPGAAGKYSYRLKMIDLDGSHKYSSTVEVEFGTPSEFALFQNFPNPFNPETKINFALKEKSEVSIVVYNSSGQQVATLVSGSMDAGYHSVMFNGNEFASGIYFYRITAGRFVETKKMVLLR
ncbi:MAG: T9SS type A sorting domain-containing protein [Ignavibacteriales bacterium]|nr:T9SS type A sorting domain-containing protein [Ignavibacteriales bacterium]